MALISISGITGLAASAITLILISIAWRVLLALGIASVTFIGVDSLVSDIETFINSKITDIGTVSNALLQMYYMMNIDVLINASLSALALYLVLKLTGVGTLTKIFFGGSS